VIRYQKRVLLFAVLVAALAGWTFYLALDQASPDRKVALYVVGTACLLFASWFLVAGITARVPQWMRNLVDHD
jgi:heme/copper-type cytochrome/quinol oxidase subunit 1